MNGSYPQHRRINIVIDRRKKDEDQNKLIMFIPPNDCNTIPSRHIPEKYFDLSRICLIPRSGINIYVIREYLYCMLCARI